EEGYKIVMRRAYIDCSSGISGDMMLGALLDAGVASDKLFAELKKIKIGYYEFRRTRAMRSGVAATRVEIKVPEKQPHRSMGDIRDLIESSKLDAAVKKRALGVFSLLAEAEGKIHNKPADKVHFHEVGAVDSILDILGCSIGVEWLGLTEIAASAVNVGGGQVETQHGLYPVPAPATAELLKDIPSYSSGVEAELATPTGAAMLKSWVKEFGGMPAMKVEKIGYGAGARDIPKQPNVVRLMVGEAVEVEQGTVAPPGDEIVSVIEANIDDMSPQLYGFFVEKAIEAGALDVSCASVQMKKNRPGLMVTVLCRPEESDGLAQVLFDQTTTIGLRIYEARRKVLEREEVNVDTSYGTVRVKVARRDGRVINFTPEYEDCRRLAEEKSVPLKQILLEANFAFMKKS
ncbi:MAG: nickel pincer cofactor biosynthesis protein LarC, partial [Acidobacteria bacterium]|nr:nickel pincer cofactor biosynthesis protein LarC [Acidobacteriota bacterium]